MSFYSRPSHLRIPEPGEKNSDNSSGNSSEIASSPNTKDDSSATPSVAEAIVSKYAKKTVPPPVTRAVSTPEIGSALEAWSSSDGIATATGTPRVREQSAPKTKEQPAPPTREATAPSKPAAPPKAVLQKVVPQKSSPQSSTDAQANQQKADQQRNAEVHQETRILVIENDVEAADHVINILESDGYAVEIATDATYGVMLAQTYLPHLILLGALSEHLTGADFMRSLRNVPGFAERAQITPVLYLIDNSQLLQQRFQGLRDTPLTSTIFKPANERELLQKIERALNPDTDFPTATA